MRLRLDEPIPVLQMRDSSKKRVRNNLYVKNEANLSHPLAKEFVIQEGLHIDRAGGVPKYRLPKYEQLGTKRAIGARRDYRGRIHIVMEEWGPKAYD